MEEKWIWANESSAKDEYAEFFVNFKCEKQKNTTLKIACDGTYSVYLNGELVAFSACADYPNYKFYDEMDITEHCKKDNEIKIVVWHFGVDSQTYINDKAGVIFKIVSYGKTVACSDENTLSRLMGNIKTVIVKR